MIVLFPSLADDAAPRLAERLRSGGQAFETIEARQGEVYLLSDGNPGQFSAWAEVAECHEIEGAYGLVSRKERETSQVPLGTFSSGNGRPVIVAGPCSVESASQIEGAARDLAAAGAHALRGGAFKPRTSPYAFQGLGEEGLQLLAGARAVTGLPVVTEVMSPEDVPAVAEHADMLQIGTRNMQNFRLLEAVGRAHKPVLLKRGMMATIDEFLAAAEYIYLRGNRDIVLCERGIRTFEPRLRNTLDLGAVALLKRLTHLPVFVDPSHGSGIAELVPDLARAAIAVGADGLLIEVHPKPTEALSDGRQSLLPSEFADLMRDLQAVGRAVGRPLAATAVDAAEASAGG
jgi:3-deoxy-7-phosphoheptulonate synthase